MSFYNKLLANYPIAGSAREQSTLLNEFENTLFDAFPWVLELEETEQNRIIEFLFGKWHAWKEAQT